MTVRLYTWDGVGYEMPVTLSWRILRTGGVPCDELEAVCLYDGRLGEVLPQISRFAAYRGEEAVLLGVLDEYEVSAGADGLLLRVAGRGMAALLLDNEAEAAVYQRATLEEILRCHVEPLGIAWTAGAQTAAAEYQVRSGSSQWSALSGFTRLAGGFLPYFTPLGQLMLAPLRGSGSLLSLSSENGVLRCAVREKRYGVLSEILVKDKVNRTSRLVVNQDLAGRGGQRRQVLYMPGRSTQENMRYTGEYQIQQSRQGARQTEITLAGAFAAQPGDVARVSYAPLSLYGTYDVVEAESAGDEDGETTTLILEERE